VAEKTLVRSYHSCSIVSRAQFCAPCCSTVGSGVSLSYNHMLVSWSYLTAGPWYSDFSDSRVDTPVVPVTTGLLFVVSAHDGSLPLRSGFHWLSWWRRNLAPIVAVAGVNQAFGFVSYQRAQSFCALAFVVVMDFFLRIPAGNTHVNGACSITMSPWMSSGARFFTCMLVLGSRTAGLPPQSKCGFGLHLFVLWDSITHSCNTGSFELFHRRYLRAFMIPPRRLLHGRCGL
jgi:hypothetical protein